METKGGKKHICSHVGCNAAFNRPYRLCQHLLIHNNIKPYNCVEVNCGKSYTNKSHLDRHRKMVHLTPEKDVIYSCPTCFKIYSNRQNLKRHIQIDHTVKVKFVCDICKSDYNKKHQLRAHMYKHSCVMSFSCYECHKDFVSLYEKKKHMRSHKVYECEECKMKFTLWSLYQKHKKSLHNNKVYTCNECGRSFNIRSHMVKHVKCHITSTDTKRVFPCTYKNCNRVYTRNSNLKQHVFIKHMNLKQKCEICEAQLSTKAKLKDHLKLHTARVPQESSQQSSKKRKPRKDKGTFKTSTVVKLGGFTDKLNEAFTSAVDLCVN